MRRLPILLMGLLNSEANDTVNYNMAYYLLNHMDTMESMNIGDLARQCNVSKATVSRFCRDLGFESFYEMRMDFADNEYIEGALSTVRVQNDEEYFTDVKTFADQMLVNVTQEALDKLANMIMNHENVVIMGHIQSGNAALMLQHDLWSMCGRVTQVLNRPSEQQSFFEDVEKPTLVILFSIHGKFFTDIYGKNQIPKLPAGSAICMLTTDCPNLPFEEIDLHLDTGTGNEFSSGNLSLILLERLIARHCKSMTNNAG